MKEFLSFAGQFAINLLGSVGVLAWIFDKWLAERLKANIKAEYEKQLANHRADLERRLEDHRSELSKLRAQLEGVQSLASTSLTLSHGEVLKRRLDAIQELWKAMRRIRHAHESVVLLDVIPQQGHAAIAESGVIDHIPMKRPDSGPGNPFLQELTAALSTAQDVRPLVGEYLFSLLEAAAVFLSMIGLLIEEGKKKGRLPAWYESTEIREMLSTTIGVEGLAAIDKKSQGKIGFVLDVVERTMLVHIGKIVSGEEAVDAALEQGRRILDATSRLELHVKTLEVQVPKGGSSS